MLHEPNEPTGEDHAKEYKSRIGVWMFLIYALVYAVFVIINVVSPLTMEVTAIFGINLASAYGFGLIILALILALIYNRMCAIKEKELNNPDEQKE
ncbi:MAG: DUF485 domain-containing protein [Anaerolineaceae bacterium]|nr:DUF485 domain-containing protein [Anaerolineaceae bacterium]